MDGKPYLEPLRGEDDSVQLSAQYRWNFTRLLLFLVLFAVLVCGSAIAYQSEILFSKQQSPIVTKQQTSQYTDNTLVQSKEQVANKSRHSDQDHQARSQVLEQRFWNSTYPFLPINNHRLNADLLPSIYNDYCSIASEDCSPEGIVYKWPLKPFNQPRPIISFLNDLRPKSMHYGVDIQARTNQKVYAIQPGYAQIIEASGLEARVQVGNFIYWHINIKVKQGEYVDPLKTVVGTVQKGFGHLHLSEVNSSNEYVNPLRPNNKILPGWTDSLPPVIGRVYLQNDGQVQVDSFDRQSLRNKKPYITPTTNLAALAYKLDFASNPPNPYSDAQQIEFAYNGATNYSFDSAKQIYDMTQPPLYGSACYPKQKKCPFFWKYNLAGGLAEPLSADYNTGDYWLTVYAWDWDNNVVIKQLKLNYSLESGWSKSK
jgi:murein DD-endopeptidase MepM/ murein hydrolase activator NlpD